MPSASRSSVAQFSVSASQLVKLIKSVSSLVLKKKKKINCYSLHRLKNRKEDLFGLEGLFAYIIENIVFFEYKIKNSVIVCFAFNFRKRNMQIVKIRTSAPSLVKRNLLDIMSKVRI